MKKEEWVKVGDRFESNSCGWYTVIEKNGEHSVVRFDTGYTTTVNKHGVRRGRVKDPLFPKIFGVGYMGVGEYVSRLGPQSEGYNSLPEYNAWINMLQRCYYDNYVERIRMGTTHYDDVVVAEEWHNYQNFAEWYVPRRELLDSYEIKRPALDKDILAAKDKSKMYGPDTCCLVPVEINGAFIGIDNEEGGIMKSYNGYYIIQKGQRVANAIETIEEAMAIRKEIKREQLVGLAVKYQEVLEFRVYDKLCNWFQVQKPLATCLN